MSHGHEKLGLDWLGRLFRRRRTVATLDSGFDTSTRPSTCTASDVSAPSSPTTSIFPSAPFIRPTSKNLVARDERGVSSSPSRRARSLPEPRPLSHRSSLVYGDEIARRSLTLAHSFRIPMRSSSLNQSRAGEMTLDGLMDSSVADAVRCCGGWSVLSGSTSASPPGKEDDAAHAPRPETPPHSSESEDVAAALALPICNKRLLPVPDALPTPEQSPELGPAPRSDFGRDLAADTHRPRGVRDGDVSARASSTSPRKSISLSELALPSMVDAALTLSEPSLDDIFSLSDDDVADTTLDSAYNDTWAPSPPDSAVSPLHVAPPRAGPRQSYLVAPSLSVQSPAASAAARAVGRMAQRHGLDMVYVLNLWPEQLSCPQHRPASPSSSASTVAPGDGMAGRLLAGFGLDRARSPFVFDARIHAEILRRDGWLEYYDPEAGKDEWVAGYGIAFHACHNPGGRWRPVDPERTSRRDGADGEETDGSRQRRNKTAPRRRVNQGIVFVCYRLQRRDGVSGRSSHEELKKLRVDAEAMVEMLIDVHRTQVARCIARTGAGMVPLSAAAAAAEAAALHAVRNGTGMNGLGSSFSGGG